MESLSITVHRLAVRSPLSAVRRVLNRRVDAVGSAFVDTKAASILMSKNNNVNPGQYKVAGRERPGEALGQEKDKQALVKSKEKSGQKDKKAKQR